MDINIILQAWRYMCVDTSSSQKQRQLEIEYCINSHFKNPNISKVHIFCNDVDITYFRNMFPNGIFIVVNNQPTYKDLLYYANTLDNNSTVCICNTDIELGTFEPYVMNKLNNKILFALTRHEIINNKKSTISIEKYVGSHDAFIFKTPVRVDIESLDFKQNTYGAENVVMNAFKNADYIILNPCYQIQIYHHHANNIYFEEYKRINTPSNTTLSSPLFILDMITQDGVPVTTTRLEPRDGWTTFDNLVHTVAPWYTRNFLSELITWDISNWKVFEYGSGNSTIWWRKNVRQVYAVDTNKEWAENVNSIYVSDKDEFVSYPLRLIDDEKFDCIIIDGDPWRDECTEYAIRCLKPNGILIIDNYEQYQTCYFDWTITNRLLKSYPKHIFHQPGHLDWKTAYWIINNTSTDIKMNREIGHGIYGTHIAPLLTAVLNTSGPVFEMGCGDFSTPLLHGICKFQNKYLLSTDTSQEWLSLFRDMESSNHEFIYVPVYEDDWEKNPKPELWNNIGNQTWGVVFIDHRPGDRRKVDVKRFADKAEIIVVHDTEYDGYGYDFTEFKYQYVYARYKTHTTILSNKIDISKLF